MIIQGFSKTSLLDYPGHVAATIFTGGCNFRCPFCHNSDLILNPMPSNYISEEEILAFLNKRKNILSGICITGGEPTLQPDLAVFIRKVKELGYAVKLDTNGYKPEVLEALLQEELLDYVAMDIKNCKKKYAQTAGVADLELGKIEKSMELLTAYGLPHEYRTTVVKEFHKKEDLEAIGCWINGRADWYLQPYRDSGEILAKVQGDGYAGGGSVMQNADFVGADGLHGYENNVLKDLAEELNKMAGAKDFETAYQKITGKNLEKVNSHTIHYGHIIDSNTKETIDEVLVSIFKAPKTYTKEDVVEINCHGGVYVTNLIYENLVLIGARPAEPGEFTKRAFLNGRIDLTKAEAVMDVIDAENKTAVKFLEVCHEKT